MNFGHIKKIHFVGIGGIGMSGIAEILSDADLEISGCDLKESAITRRLERLGIRVIEGHDASHAEGHDLIVTSSAVRHDNAEVARARELDIPVIRRAEMLGEIMRQRRSIAISGTHGKTTTSALTSLILTEAGLDPTMIVGGVMRNLESNARLGKGEFLVVEADEFDRSFLALDPTWAVVTNIEADHLDCYPDLDAIKSAFAEFVRKVPPLGMVIGCIDDPAVAELLESVPVRSLSYGTSERADLRSTDLRFDEGGSWFTVTLRGERLGEIRLAVPGQHNVRNALAALAVALEIGVEFPVAAQALSKFRGVERRFQMLGECNGAIIVDDYAHHPTEIRATVDGARRSFPRRRIVALFQPHLYSRTRDFFAEFAEALSTADLALVTPIYPAREEPIEGVSSALITDAATRRGAENVEAVTLEGEQLVEHLRSQLGSGDLLLTMGAGDINLIGEALVRGGG
jgi:UDP-N-acetylmuramate--alanine ligase